MRINSEIADDIVDRIPTGHLNARHLILPDTRLVRHKINKANLSGDIIINVGNGYYRPDFDNEVDTEEFWEYVASETARAADIMLKVDALVQASQRIKKEKE